MGKPNYAFAKRQRDLARKQRKEERKQRKEAAALENQIKENPPETTSDEKADSTPPE